MTPDTITIRQIEDFQFLLHDCVMRLESMLDAIEESEITPEQAAEKIACMVDDINQAAKP